MKTVFDHLRDRLLQSTHLHTQTHTMPPLEQLKTTENHKEVWNLCDNRMLLGAFRYELLVEKAKAWEKKGHVEYDLIAEAYKRISLYEEDGNREHLLDTINMLAIEFRFPSHPNAHFNSTDDGHHAEKVK